MTTSLLGPRGSYSVQAGKFRHVVNIQQQVKSRDSAGGAVSTWADFATNVRAAIEDVGGDEKVSAQQTNSVISTAISIRWRPGIHASMRIVHTPKGEPTRYYNVKGIQNDETGRCNITLYCERRDSHGLKSDGR